MDRSDPEITFDAAGLCSHCQRYDALFRSTVERADAGLREPELEALVDGIKAVGRGKQYDCIVGVSGGVDSTYVLWTAKQRGLRPLAVHFDSGWNSELAVNNIESITRRLDVDLYTDVVNWPEMRDLQLAFLRSGVPNADTPTDHAFPAVAFAQAKKYDVKHVLTGSNYATEGVLPRAWGYQAGDARHLRDVHKQFGERPLTSYPVLGLLKKDVYYRYVARIRTVPLLNYLPYDKRRVKQLITEELGWRDYGGKHYESVFTRFFQGYYLPERFGYDKRRAHLASLINSGQATREQALLELQEPSYSLEQQAADKAFVAKKLGITTAGFDDILAAPTRTHRDYVSCELLYARLFRLRSAVRRSA